LLDERIDLISCELQDLVELNRAELDLDQLQEDFISYKLQAYVKLNLHASLYTRKENTLAGLNLNTQATMFQLVFRYGLRLLIVHADKQICSGGPHLRLSMLVYSCTCHIMNEMTTQLC
jgi:hypothetical protein